MSTSRVAQCDTYLRYWQRRLGLTHWTLTVELVDFSRPDSFVQSGDIEVDVDKKKAVVKLTTAPTGKDRAIILHELFHLVLWEYDHYCEANLPESAHGGYFTHLETAVAKMTDIILTGDEK